MGYAESYVFVFLLNAALAVPIGVAIKTLLGMEERKVVPILRVRTPKGDVHAITYKRLQTSRQPIGLVRDYVPATPAKFII